MSESKHTPGPWKWYYDITDPYGLQGADGKSILRAVDGTVYSEYSSDPATIEISSPEDARLIAAAPELLEVLQSFVQQEVEYMTINNLGDPEKQHNVKWARAVIAKAGVRT